MPSTDESGEVAAKPEEVKNPRIFRDGGWWGCHIPYVLMPDRSSIALFRERDHVEQFLAILDAELRLQCELQRLKPKERLVLTQFYAAGRPKEEIRAEMNLTDKQFRLLKHRSKARLAEYCLRKTLRMPRRNG